MFDYAKTIILQPNPLGIIIITTYGRITPRPRDQNSTATTAKREFGEEEENSRFLGKNCLETPIPSAPACFDSDPKNPPTPLLSRRRSRSETAKFPLPLDEFDLSRERRRRREGCGGGRKFLCDELRAAEGGTLAPGPYL
jgi:hypothetical protein